MIHTDRQIERDGQREGWLRWWDRQIDKEINRGRREERKRDRGRGRRKEREEKEGKRGWKGSNGPAVFPTSTTDLSSYSPWQPEEGYFTLTTRWGLAKIHSNIYRYVPWRGIHITSSYIIPSGAWPLQYTATSDTVCPLKFYAYILSTVTHW